MLCFCIRRRKHRIHTCITWQVFRVNPFFSQQTDNTQRSRRMKSAVCAGQYVSFKWMGAGRRLLSYFCIRRRKHRIHTCITWQVFRVNPFFSQQTDNTQRSRRMKSALCAGQYVSFKWMGAGRRLLSYFCIRRRKHRIHTCITWQVFRVNPFFSQQTDNTQRSRRMKSALCAGQYV